jgi:hypothetical protein
VAAAASAWLQTVALEAETPEERDRRLRHALPRVDEGNWGVIGLPASEDLAMNSPRPGSAVPRVLLFAMALLAGGCGQPDGDGRPAPAGVDISTDDRVREAFRDAMDIDERTYLDVMRPEELPGVVIVRTLIPDMGARILGGFVGEALYEPADLTRAGLLHLGWSEAAPQDRADLAMRWVRRSGLFGFVVETPDGEFAKLAGAPFKAPTAEPTDDGGVLVSFWTASGWNIAGTPMYGHVRLRFDADARQLAASTR